ncbi:MAG: fimbrillin family protein [Phocaeicola sp.]
MKKTTINLLLICSLFSACQQTNVENTKTKEVISMKAHIGASETHARYLTTDGKESNFTDNDQIGLYRDEEAVVKWSYEENKWKSEKTMYWENPNQEYCFYAYYPFSHSEQKPKTDVVMPDLSTQSGSLTTLYKYDFLAAQIINQSYDDGKTISFTGENNCFKHISCLVKLTFKAQGDLKDATLNNIQLTGDNLTCNTTYAFDKETGGNVCFGEEVTSSSVTTDELNEQASSEKEYYFVVNQFSDSENLIKLTLQYTKQEQKYSISTNFTNTSFLSGKLHHYDITIMNGNVQITGSDIKDWETNGDTEEIIIDGDEKEKA